MIKLLSRNPQVLLTATMQAQNSPLSPGRHQQLSLYEKINQQISHQQHQQQKLPLITPQHSSSTAQNHKKKHTKQSSKKKQKQ